MSLPMVMLGGVPIELHAGAPSQQYSSLGGQALIRLSAGQGVPMTHWQKTAISISGTGWMPPGLDGLDYRQPLELRCTKPMSMAGTELEFRLNGVPRPDVAPWAQALVLGQWQTAAVEMNADVAQVSPVPGATLYRVCWMPIFTVTATSRRGDLDASAAIHGWQIDCEEL
ncbi:hypothetical protein UB43_03430 [Pseudomonas sp. 21]|uniref:hypothetical protein n=1 Tax=Pseudomonas sp. 21 TaxID=1619948 RepID=UPI0005EBD1B1|nr:hypothetical protein [Pseudomonas sp. 21]KJK03563.1 hypothetical protein UB43_03430 [Pseudomonas sp. 21]